VRLLQVAAVVLWLAAALAGFGWWVHASLHAIAGLIAAGLVLYALGGASVPSPPVSR